MAIFTIERRHAPVDGPVMVLPGYLLLNTDSGMVFEPLLEGNAVKWN